MRWFRFAFLLILIMVAQASLLDKIEIAEIGIKLAGLRNETRDPVHRRRGLAYDDAQAECAATSAVAPRQDVEQHPVQPPHRSCAA